MMNKTAIAAAMALTLGTGVASAAPWAGNFTMYSPAGFQFAPDTTVTGQELSTLESTTLFFGYTWVAKGLQTYASNFTVDTIEGGIYTNVVVGAGQVGGSLLFDWGAADTSTACGQASCNIDVIQVWDVVANVDGTTSYVSTAVTDSNGTNAVPGLAMIDGPFQGYNANFNMTTSAVPVPAAVWLFGSGLLGLVGVARRKKSA